MELWDAYDRNFQKIENAVLARGEAIPDGMYHLVCEIAVRHADGSYLLTQRDPNKHFGSMWEVTAGGSALRGETPIACARRELREETGICADDLRELGRVIGDDRHTLYFEFFCQTDCPKDSVRLQENETVAYRWTSAEEIRQMPPDVLVTTRMRRFLPDLQ